MQITDKELFQLNTLGLIPGPEESADAFFVRVQYCLNLKQTLAAQVAMTSLETEEGKKLIQEAAPITRELYDIVPQWTPIVFSNQKLAPWHGGSAWIFQLTEDSPTASFLQLREAFAYKKRYLGLYDRAEVVAHELSHVGRMQFQEPKFEELLAYKTSRSWFRRYFGPIVESLWEIVVFIVLILLSLFIDFFLIASGAIYSGVALLKILPWVWLGIGLVRVCLRQRQFKRCLTKLEELSSNPNAVIYRLTDDEIIRFGKMTVEEIKEYFRSDSSLRCRLIVTYLK